MKISFLVQVYVGEKTFSKKSKLSIFLDQQAEFTFKKDKIVFFKDLHWRGVLTFLL